MRRSASPAGITCFTALALALVLPGAGLASLVDPPSGDECEAVGMGFFTVPPCRAFDSRSGESLAAGSQRLQLAGRCGIPFEATAVAANLTTVGPQAPGYLTIYSGNAPVPATITIAFNAGQVRANSAVVELAHDGTGTIAAYYGAEGPGALTATVDLILDVSGFFVPSKLKRRLAVFGVSPPYGSQFGGEVAVVSGTFPDPAHTGVQFDQQEASPAAVPTKTALLVTVPPFTGTFPTGPCAEGGLTGTVTLPAIADITVADAVTGCSTTLTGGYTYLPTDGSCHLPPPPPPPVASFTVSRSSANDVAIFSDTSTGGPLSWFWNFGDAQISTVQNPVHDYMAPGTFLVTLTACNVGGCSTANQFVNVPGS